MDTQTETTQTETTQMRVVEYQNWYTKRIVRIKFNSIESAIAWIKQAEAGGTKAWLAKE